MAKPRISSIPGWSSQSEGANISLTKSHGNETITVKVNVNHAVDADENAMPEGSQESETSEPTPMSCKPDFCVEISKGNQIFALNCSFTNSMMQEDDAPRSEERMDLFHIVEVTLYEKEFGDSTYMVAGEVMDGYLYDLIMNWLAERGVNDDFASKLIDLSTGHEQKQYVGLLEGLKKFLSQ